MQFVPFILPVILLIFLVSTIPSHIREERRRKKWLQDYQSNGGRPYVSKSMWDRDGTSKIIGESWEERQEINADARIRADLAQRNRDELIAEAAIAVGEQHV